MTANQLQFPDSPFYFIFVVPDLVLLLKTVVYGLLIFQTHSAECCKYLLNTLSFRDMKKL